MFVFEFKEICRDREKGLVKLDEILAGKFGVIVRITATVGWFD